MNQQEFTPTLDDLAGEAGGYVVMPSQEDIEYLDLLFEICSEYGIRYASATPRQRAFVDEVTRVTWEYEHGCLERGCFEARSA